MGARVSFIIPFRDKIELVNDCLRTIAPALASDLPDCEFVLVDNGSSASQLAKLEVPAGVVIAVLSAPVEFNFQHLCNLGAKQATGAFLFFLNSDILFTERSLGFLPRMVAQAAKPDVGAVGNLLFYPDGTIQHAGAVVGMNGYADHLYRGWTEAQAAEFSFAGPRADRWVSAVTAASLLVERRKFEQVGGFDERFIVCGGDVDLCLRLDKAGFHNLYLGSAEMIHLESKSRDPNKIPEVDFRESERSYGAYLGSHGGRDPFYPEPLSLEHLPPLAKRGRRDELRAGLRWGKSHLRTATAMLRDHPVEVVVADYLGRLRRKASQRLRKEGAVKIGRTVSAESLRVPLTRPAHFVNQPLLDPQPRLNVVLPILRERDVYGGILTAALVAMKFKAKHPEMPLRFLLTEGEGDAQTLKKVLAPYFGAELADLQVDVIPIYDRRRQAAPVHARDVFMATAWWTCYTARQAAKPFFYLIQDFEPGFYAWSDEHAASLATYAMDMVPIFNSSLLRTYFSDHHLTPPGADAVSFEPALPVTPNHAARAPGAKRKLFVYGRRTVGRNLFGTAVLGLQAAIERGVIDSSWELVSAGEYHDPIALADGLVLQSAGKMSLSAYREFLSTVDVGISLMLSPHPSYPPLELAATGAICVTNGFANKNLGDYFANVVSCAPSIEGVADGVARAVELLSAPLVDVKKNPFPKNWDTALAPALAHLEKHFLRLAELGQGVG